jgi:hypothetical protein
MRWVIMAIVMALAVAAFGQQVGQEQTSSIETLTAEAATRLVAGKKPSLDLSGLTTLSDDAAEALSKHDGSLTLNGLMVLSPHVAEAVAKTNGWLRLHGLTTISPEVARALAKHEGPLELPGRSAPCKAPSS